MITMDVYWKTSITKERSNSDNSKEEEGNEREKKKSIASNHKETYIGELYNTHLIRIMLAVCKMYHRST